jgi:Ca-activated chloride channel homolog
MLRFAQPELLLLIALLPLLALWRGKKGRAPSIEYSSTELARDSAQVRKYSAGGFLASLRVFSLLLLIIAFARPQLGKGTTEIEASGIDIVLAIDVSGSMEAMDFKMGGTPKTRLDVVKSVVSKFIDARPNDRMGLVVFAGRSYLVSPLTLDHAWLQQNLERVQLGLIEDGTAIGSGLATSVNRLREQASKSKIVVLLTDGVNNAGKVTPVAAADAARALGIKVYTIAAGSRGEAPIYLKDQFGHKHLRMMPVEVDEEILKKVAETTDGKFFRATDTDSLGSIYGEIDRLEKTKVTMKRFQHYQELFHWALIPGVALLLAEVGLSQTRFRRLP